MNIDPVNPQKFKGLNNSQVFAGAILIDGTLLLGSMVWLFTQNFEKDKFYIFLIILLIFFILIVPWSLGKFLFKVEEEITKRLDIVSSKRNGKKFAQQQIDKLKKVNKDSTNEN